MTCRICVKYFAEARVDEDEGHSYVTGCVHFRKPSLQAHQNSDTH